MRQTQDTYLGWEELSHHRGCKQPRWDVSVRTNDDELRDSVVRHRSPGEDPVLHKCEDKYCDHGNRFAELVVRIVCRSCGAAEVIKGEETADTGRSTTSTAYLGYGLPPRKVAGLFLWPGEPWLNFGRLGTAEPHDFLVTAERVARVEREHVVGAISQTRGKRGAMVWTAAAVQSPTGPYGAGLGLRWAHVEEGFKTIAAAAKWIAAQAAEQQSGGAS